MSSSSKPASPEEEGLLALACHCRVTPLTGKQWWATERHPMVPGQWHECLTEALRVGLGRPGKGLLLLGLLRQGGWQGNTPPSKSYQHQEQEEMDSTIPGKKGPSGGRQGSLMLFPLRLRTEVSGLRREV